MLSTLNFFYGLTGSYGIAIILLTLAVRLLLHPLSHKQMVSMQRMQKIQPRLKILQEKYGNDKEKLNQEMMRLYKENGVNPIAGCLPLLCQLPVFILLYRVLMQHDYGSSATFLGVQLSSTALDVVGHAVGLSGKGIQIGALLSGIAANPGGLVTNMMAYLPVVILIIIVGFLTWYQQKLSMNSNPQMAFMNWFMPIFMSFICLSLPGGVMIYWGSSSFISVAQQQWVTSRTQKEIVENKPVLYKNRPTGSDGDEVISVESKPEGDASHGGQENRPGKRGASKSPNKRRFI